MHLWWIAVTIVGTAVESFIIPTPTTVTSTRLFVPQQLLTQCIPQQQQQQQQQQHVNHHGGRIAVLSAVNQDNTNNIDDDDGEDIVTTKTKRRRRTWEESFELLVSYKEKNGNCNVPRNYKEDPRLGTWVNSQRQQKETLNEERIAKLEGLGFSWSREIFEEQWDEMFERLVQYAKENNGDCNIPCNDDDDVNKKLFLWVRDLRQRKSLLSKERQSKLNKLGLIWEGADKVKMDHKWNTMYERLKEYHQEHGHCLVPTKWNDDPALGKWVIRQRQEYKLNRLCKERIIQLDQISFTWKVRNCRQRNDLSKMDWKWFVMYGRLLNFLNEHGHCDVPRGYKKDPSLGRWVITQRQKQKLILRDTTTSARRLGDDRKELLDDIGLRWSFNDQRDEQWREKYEELKSFKEQNGHIRLPKGSLESWACQQRVLFAAGRVQQKRKALLDEIEFRWDIETRI